MVKSSEAGEIFSTSQIILEVGMVDSSGYQEHRMMLT